MDLLESVLVGVFRVVKACDGRRTDLGAKGRARAEALFDAHKNADALLAVYQEVMRR